MKLSKTTTIAITSASAVIYGFGVVAMQVHAQEGDLLSPEVSQEIQETLGEGDSDELLVDALSQVESQLRELQVRSYAPEDTDSEEVAQLKQLRREYIQRLRNRMQSLDGTERGEFRQKIQDRRKEVRETLLEKRKELRQEREQQRKDRVEAQKQDFEDRKESFKENLQKRLDDAAARAEERSKTAEEKFSERLEEKQQRMEEKESQSEVKRAIDERKEAQRRAEVKGAIDYQPTNPLERIGYWLRGI